MTKPKYNKNVVRPNVKSKPCQSGVVTFTSADFTNTVVSSGVTTATTDVNMLVDSTKNWAFTDPAFYVIKFLSGLHTGETFNLNGLVMEPTRLSIDGYSIAGVVDATGKTVTNSGVEVSSLQGKFGNGSGNFSGANDYLQLADSDDWNFTGDFTVDFWIRFNSLDGVQSIYQQGSDENNHIGMHWQDGKFAFYMVNASEVLFSLIGTDTISINTWYHVAVVRSGDEWYMFRDGTQIAYALDSVVYLDSAASLYIGRLGTDYDFNGYLDEFRVSKGIARWTSGFSVPTSEYAVDSYTKLLLHFNYTLGQGPIATGTQYQILDSNFVFDISHKVCNQFVSMDIYDANNILIDVPSAIGITIHAMDENTVRMAVSAASFSNIVSTMHVKVTT